MVKRDERDCEIDGNVSRKMANVMYKTQCVEIWGDVYR